jgi:hypothetical protein
MDSFLIDWDGSALPEELRRLPPGRYVIEPVATPLAPEEEEGLLAGLDELDAGAAISLADALRELRGGQL